VGLYAYESPGPRVALLKAVKPLFSKLVTGSTYQLQHSADMANWTNAGFAFEATDTEMVYPQYWDVDNWYGLFFRVIPLP
jgi:hypothetical protein